MIKNNVSNNGGGHAHHNNRSNTRLNEHFPLSRSQSEASTMSEVNVFSPLRSRSNSRVNDNDDNNKSSDKSAKDKRKSKKNRNQKLETTLEQLQIALAAIQQLTIENRSLQDEIRGYKTVLEASMNNNNESNQDIEATAMDFEEVLSRKRQRQHSPLNEVNQELQRHQVAQNDEIFRKQQELRQNLGPSQTVACSSVQTVQRTNPFQHRTPMNFNVNHSFPELKQVKNSFDQLVNRPRPQPVTNQNMQPMGSATNAANTPTHKVVNSNDNGKSKQTPTTTTNSTTNSALPLPTIKNRKPPFIVAFDINTRKLYGELAHILGHTDFIINNKTPRRSHIQARNRKDYDDIVKKIAEMQIEHHRFTPYEDRIINIILRNMCPTFELVDIEQGIEDLQLDIQVHQIQRYETEKSKREFRKLNMWLVQLKPGSNVSELLRITRFLCQTNVLFERRQSNDIIQCKNCQHFGHTARNCSRKFRCVKCPVDHTAGNCPTDINFLDDLPLQGPRRQPACVNCGALDHPASFRGCPAHIQLIKKKQELFQQQQEQRQFRQQSVNNYRTPNINYSQMVRGRTSNENQPTKVMSTTQNNDENCFSFLQQECNNVFGLDLFTIQRNARNFAPKYKMLQGIQKQEALIEFILSITPNI